MFQNEDCRNKDNSPIIACKKNELCRENCTSDCNTKQLTKDQAIEFHDSKKWEHMNFEERAKFQINQSILCMPFSVFHEAVEKTINRPVFTHEFGVNIDGIKSEIDKVIGAKQ